MPLTRPRSACLSLLSSPTSSMPRWLSCAVMAPFPGCGRTPRLRSVCWIYSELLCYNNVVKSLTTVTVLPSGHCPVPPGPRCHAPRACAHHRHLCAARRGHLPGGDERRPEGEGHQDCRPLHLSGRRHRLPSAAQRAVCHRRAPGKCQGRPPVGTI